MCSGQIPEERKSMKHTKKLAALLVALVMVLAMGVGASAAEDPKETITNVPTPQGGFRITLTDLKNDRVAVHDYEAYQIFKGTLAKSDNATPNNADDDKLILSDIVWGDNVNDAAGLATALKNTFDSETDAKYKKIKELKADSTARQVAEAIAALEAGVDSADAQKIAAVIGAVSADGKSYLYLQGDPKGTGDLSFTVPVAGYYFIADKLQSLDGQQQTAYTRYILQVMNDVRVITKAIVPSSEKKVKDTNDSVADASNTDDYTVVEVPVGTEEGSATETSVTQRERDTADYDIGDDAPFILRAKLPISELHYYDTYQFAFVDDMSVGLTYNNDAKVSAYAANISDVNVITKVADIYTATAVTGADVTGTGDGQIASVYEGGKVWKFNLGDILDSNNTYKVDKNKTNYGTAEAPANAAYIVIELTYTAKLNGSAVIGNPGNPNKSYIEYSNNANAPTSKGRTPDDINVVFTYKVDIDKVDDEYKPLPRAGFTLLKKIDASKITLPEAPVAEAVEPAEAMEPAEAGSDVEADAPAAAGPVEIKDKMTYTVGQIYFETVNNVTVYWKAVGVIAASAEGTSFEFKGIDDGTYRLVESETPPGYNTMIPVDFTVTAEHEDDPEELVVTSLTVDPNTFITSLTAGAVNYTRADLPENDENRTKPVQMTSGEIYTEIINLKGTVLPATGGIGRKIFYIGGGALLVAAAVLLIARRRMAAK